MTPEELEAIEARANAATEGPWGTRVADTGIRSSYPYAWVTKQRGEIATAIVERHQGGTVEDVEFIAHAREDIPALLAAVRERDNTIAKVHELMQSWDNGEYDDSHQFSPHHFVRHLRAALDPQETP
ncbi:hypothetical protein CH276_14120 [Rhodococcus sp. 06-470-2]|uniref:hypothetical protein n=1 Tax=unclassified Rhodococcus (in: high G+C Gram-positive bacteria) TaxID=192944 RepID=UPI000B9AB773|nr:MULTISPECIES: hypothetical protein [unclassified Rhodococcus (in: high G+C Gram-positive bacteria)]OZC62752.1 hypothetical protein CH276_14120 [Rhodococcus sp. 06-470-2]OZE71729.1 hypothetical protein CH265_01600 [Rhodococcus sp. 05-2221-1B]